MLAYLCRKNEVEHLKSSHDSSLPTESSKIVNLVQDDGRPETFKLTSTEELKEIIDGNGASGIKPIEDPHSRVLRDLKDVESGKTYMLVWGMMSQAKSLGM